MIYEFMATQDLHGYSKPWAGGTNDNQFDPEIFSTWAEIIGDIIQFDGSIAGSGGNVIQGDFPITTGDSWLFSVYPAGNDPAGVGRLKLYENGVQKFDSNSYATIPRNYPYTASVDTDTIGIIPKYSASESTVTGGIRVMAITGSVAPESYTPYANVCMPEGFDIWDPTNQEYIQVYAGYVNANTRELYLRPVYEEYAGEELVGPWMSSLDPYEEDTTPTEGAFVIDFGGELTSYEITPFMLQTLLESLGIRQHFTDGAGLLNKLMDQAQGRVRSEEELLHLSRPLNVIAIGDQLPAGLTFKPISKDVLPGLPGKFIR